MQYNGHELKEANGADYQLGSTTKRMLVWNSGCDYPVKGEVLGYHQGRWVESDARGIGVCSWLHAAEIPTEEETLLTNEETLLTNRELAKWLAQGNGQVSFDDKAKNFGKDTEGNRFKAMCSAINWTYFGADNFFVTDVLIRKWDDTEWRKPTREYAFGN